MMNNDKLLNIFSGILEEINDVIVVRNEFGSIIYSNKNIDSVDYIKLSLLGQSKDEILFNDRLYKCQKSQISIGEEICEVEVYTDHTKYQELKEKAELDHLTNLINKRGIDVAMIKAEEDYNANPIPFTIIMGDIDKFKMINDTVGHPNGDKVLKTVSTIIKNNIRTTDIAGRYGGEEFLIILKSCDIHKAYDIVETIRKTISEFPFEFKGIPNISMSFGMSTYDGTKSIEEILEEADSALYESKNNGRNQTTKYDSKKYVKR